MLFWRHRKVRVTVSSDVTSFTENGSFEEELANFLVKIKGDVSEAVVFPNENVCVNKGTTGAYVSAKQFVNVANKYPKIKFLLDKDQLSQLNKDDYVWVSVDQLKKVKQTIRLTSKK